MYSPKEMASICSDAGVAKAQLRAHKAFLLGVFAGAFIALGGLASVAASAGLSGAAERVVRAAVFPAGLTFVIVAGAELFTGNCLMLQAVLEKRVEFSLVAKKWTIVYAGNLAGSLLVALLTVGAFGARSQVAQAFLASAVVKTSLPWGQAFLRGVGCNFLVCIAVWSAFSTKHTAGKIMALWPAIFAFVVCGMEHSVANMAAIPTGMMAAAICGMPGPDVEAFVWHNLIPVTLGNIAGGALVAAGYWMAYLRGRSPDKLGGIMEKISSEGLLSAIKSRRSVRKYTSEAVDRADIEKVVEAGLWAASGMGRQATKIIAVTDKTLRDKLSAMNAKVMGNSNDPFYGAPVVLVVLYKNDCPTGVYDGSLVMGDMMLMASGLGLGSCWIHRAREEFESAEGKEILKSLGVDGQWTGVGHLILGHTTEAPAAAQRTEGRVVWA